MSDRDIGQKSKKGDEPPLSPKSLRKKRLRALGQLPPSPEKSPSPKYDECAICTEPITSDGYKHCAHSHNHKTCLRQWIHHAIQNRNQRANQCGTCFKPFTKAQLREIGVNKNDISQLYPRARRLTESERIKQIIDEIMNNNFAHIRDIIVHDRNLLQELMDYFNAKNNERLDRLNITADLRINVDVSHKYDVDNVNINQPLHIYMHENHKHKIEKVICYNNEYRGSHLKTNTPLDFIKDVGHKYMNMCLINNIHVDTFQRYLQTNSFTINIYVDTNEYDIDGYMLPSKPYTPNYTTRPCKDSGCTIMGGNRRRGSRRGSKRGSRNKTKTHRRR
jgi:hypothetical protein